MGANQTVFSCLLLIIGLLQFVTGRANNSRALLTLYEDELWPSKELAQAMQDVQSLWANHWVLSSNPQLAAKQAQVIEDKYNEWKQQSYAPSHFKKNPKLYYWVENLLDLGVNFGVGGGIGGVVTKAVAGGAYAFGTGGINAVVETLAGMGLDKATQKLPDPIGKGIKHTGLKIFWDKIAKDTLKSTLSGASTGAVFGAGAGALGGTVVGAIFPPALLGTIPGGAAGGAIVGSITGAIVGFTWGLSKGIVKGVYMVYRNHKKKKILKNKKEKEYDSVAELFLFEQLPIEYQKRLLFTLDCIKVQQEIYAHRFQRKEAQYKQYLQSLPPKPNKKNTKAFKKRVEPNPVYVDKSRNIEEELESTISLIEPSMEYDQKPVLPIVTGLFKDIKGGHPKMKNGMKKMMKLPMVQEVFFPIEQQIRPKYMASDIHKIATKTNHPLYLAIPKFDMETEYEKLFEPTKTFISAVSKLRRDATVTKLLTPEQQVDINIAKGSPEVLAPPQSFVKHINQLDAQQKGIAQKQKSSPILPDFNDYPHYHEYNNIDYYGNSTMTSLYATIAVLFIIILCCIGLWCITVGIIGVLSYYACKWKQNEFKNKKPNFNNNQEIGSML